jgi:hypothetical protein
MRGGVPTFGSKYGGLIELNGDRGLDRGLDPPTFLLVFLVFLVFLAIIHILYILPLDPLCAFGPFKTRTSN